MAIAGVEPECNMRELVEHPRMYAYIPHGVELYTREQVREILLKLLINMSVEGVDGLSTLKNIPDKGLVTEQSEKLVDEFMESGRVNDINYPYVY